MGKWQRSVLSLLVIIVSLLSLTNVTYRKIQRDFYLEANDLYSKNAVEVTGTVKSNRTLLTRRTLFKNVTDDKAVRVIQTNYAVQFPLYAGRNLTPKDEGKALAGSSVVLVSDQGKDYFEYENKRYEVVGYLGTKKHSLLSDRVLLLDGNLFESVGEARVVIDEFPLWEMSFDGQASGTNILGRRTTVDYISPLFQIYCFILIFFIACIIGNLLEKYTRQFHYVLVIKGISHWDIFFKTIRNWNGFLFLSYLGTILINKLLFLDTPLLDIGILLASSLIIVNSSFSIVYLTRRRGRD